MTSVASPKVQRLNGREPALPPHDIGAEEAVVAALFLDGEYALPRVRAARLEPGDFFREQNRWCYEACLAVADRGEEITLTTAAHELDRQGRLDAVGGEPFLVELANKYFTAIGVEAHARIVARDALYRRLIDAAGEIAKVAYRGEADEGAVLAEAVAQLDRIREAHSVATAGSSSWHFQDPDIYAEPGAIGDPPPELFRREDGEALFYRGAVNALYGESGSLKSWTAQVATAQVLLAGGRVAYYDFEANGGQIHERLRALGIAAQQLRESFRYVHPADPLGGAELSDLERDLRDFVPDLVIIDGTTDAMALHGLDLVNNRDYAHFDRMLPKRIASFGPAVALIDHVGRNVEARGGYALGAQHKRASITGAAYTVELVQPFGRGKHGIARLKVSKDRAGYVDALTAGGRRVAEVHLESDLATGSIAATVTVPEVSEDGRGNFRPTVLMERVSRAVETSPGIGINGIYQAVTGKRDTIKLALDTLVSEGYVARTTAARNKLEHTSLHAYREETDPARGTVTPLFPDRSPVSLDDRSPVPPPSRGERGTVDYGAENGRDRSPSAGGFEHENEELLL